jgi:tetratricopeptide (TPR) repeat protein
VRPRRLTGVKFRDNDHLLQIIDPIVSKVGRRVDETSPMVAARLLDGEHRPRRLKDWAPAIEALRHAAALEPENRQNRNMLGYCLARALYNLTRMLHHVNQDTEARQHLQAAVKADPQFDPAQRMLAQLEGASRLIRPSCKRDSTCPPAPPSRCAERNASKMDLPLRNLAPDLPRVEAGG